MTVPEEGCSELLENFGVAGEDYEIYLRESRKLVEYVSGVLGDRNFWQVSEKEFSFIYSITSSLRPDIVVETGVGPGTTSFAFLSALENNGGKLVSFDLGKNYGEEKVPEPVGFVVPDRLRKNWHLILGDSNETLPVNISKFGPPSIFMHDSEHTYEHVTFELETAISALKGNFLIIVDNYDWTDAPADFARKHNLVINRVADDMCYMYRKKG